MWSGRPERWQHLGHIDFDPSTFEGREGYFLLTGLVVPRPIAWVSTVAADGSRNLAPHSYFNAISSNPLVVHFTSTGVKDSLRNVKATGEFVINIVSAPFAEVMNLTAANFPPDEDEFNWANLEDAPSTTIAPPRVAGASAAFECTVNRIVSIGNGHMVFGDVTHLVVDEDVMREGRIAPDLLDPIGRLGGSWYTRAASDLFKMRRPTYDELRSERGEGAE
jgi:flavin reductase (DIM6/NTAB) family NADH-FMN oxidoreductase RutF